MAVMLTILFIVFYKSKQNKIFSKMSEEDKNILKVAKEKTRGVRLGIGILSFVLLIVLNIVLNNSCGIFKVTYNNGGLLAVVDAPVDDVIEPQSPKSDIFSVAPVPAANNVVGKIWRVIFNFDATVIVPVLFAIIVFNLYIKKTKGLNDKERELMTLYYDANIITGILFFIINFIYTSACKIVIGTADKPIIYLYPEEKQNVKVKVDKEDNLTHTYPKYNGEWNVEAYPDGTLIDENGKKYYALYWEGVEKNINVDMKKGFCVKGEDTIAFLEEKLALLGLNYKEAQEFIVYWLPQMENNKYNYIYFKQTEEVNEVMGLDITPMPDTLIRVLMYFKPLEKEVEVEEEKIVTPQRNGFTVVEWGGVRIK